MSKKINRRLSLKRALWGAALAWTACFAALPSYSATATLTGVTTNTCTYTTTSVDSLGNITVACNTVPQPGQIAFAQSTYGANINDNSFQVTVNRNNGTVGAVGATVSATGGCTVNGGGTTTVAFADAIATPVALVVATPPTPTTCSLALSASTGGAALGGAATINVIDPTQPGVFSFASATSSANTGVTNHNVVIQRTGGSNGAYDVAFTATPTGLTGYSATVSPVQFTNGQTTANIVVNAGTTAGNVVYTLTGAAPVAPNLTPTGLGTTTAHTLTVASPSSCPAPGSNVTVRPQPAGFESVEIGSGPNGSIHAIPVPANTGRLRIYKSSQTPSNFNTTIVMAQCPGEVVNTWPQPTILSSPPVPCRKQAGQQGTFINLSMVPSNDKCIWTSAQRTTQWYYNIRIDNCDTGNCLFRYTVEY